MSPWRTIQAEHDAGVRAASAALGEAAWAGAHAQGAALTEPEAIADALAFAAARGRFAQAFPRTGGVSCPPR